MTIKKDSKSEEKLTCQFKIGMGNFTKFKRSTRKSQTFPLSLAAFDQSISCLS